MNLQKLKNEIEKLPASEYTKLLAWMNRNKPGSPNQRESVKNSGKE